MSLVPDLHQVQLPAADDNFNTSPYRRRSGVNKNRKISVFEGFPLAARILTFLKKVLVVSIATLASMKRRFLEITGSKNAVSEKVSILFTKVFLKIQIKHFLATRIKSLNF